jgi:hypothetical protein
LIEKRNAARKKRDSPEIVFDRKQYKSVPGEFLHSCGTQPSKPGRSEVARFQIEEPLRQAIAGKNSSVETNGQRRIEEEAHVVRRKFYSQRAREPREPEIAVQETFRRVLYGSVRGKIWVAEKILCFVPVFRLER